MNVEGDVCSRNLKGAEVNYGHGAEISRVDLHTDFSAVQISGLTAESRLEPLQELLSDLGFPIPLDKFRSKTLAKGKIIVEIKIKDPEFARKVVAKFNKEVGKSYGEVEIKPLQVGTENKSLSGNKLQMSSVICSWFKASTTAWLHYSTEQTARRAKDILIQHGKILGRNLQIKLELPSLRRFSNAASIITVEVGNLDPSTKSIHFTSLLNNQKPKKIVFGRPSHQQSELGAERIVRELLLAEGMDSWELISTSGTAQAKGSARFESREAASQAVKKLHKTKLHALGRSQIFLTHVSSVKFSVPVEMAKVLQGSITEMQMRLKESGHTHLRSYPPAHASSLYTVLRISGQDVKQVARTKSELERLLNGNVVEMDGSYLWDPYFATLAGLAFIRELHAANNVYIHRDNRKQRLAVYGNTKNVATTRDALQSKVQALSELNHTLVLTPQLLQKALSGGWQAIIHKFGKDNATLDIARQPKTIKIRGSSTDFQEALALFLKNSNVKQEELLDSDKICAVCFTEATDPFDTPCHHTYCTECFTNQCTSANGKDIPVRCYGDSANCKCTFSIPTLHKILPAQVFEQLLENSFASYLRAHPREFQYCPTPDCSQVFRISSNGISFDCSACLASICTSCALVSHDGLSCAAYKDLVTEGNQAFQKYKAKHDIRDCPQCSTSIEKTYGCNHMACGGCSAHICWFCMETFGSDRECYKHMERGHNGIGL